MKAACRSCQSRWWVWRLGEMVEGGGGGGANPNSEKKDDVGARGFHWPGGRCGVGPVRCRGSDRDCARLGAPREVADAHGERHVAGGATAPGRPVGGDGVLSARTGQRPL